MKSLFITLILIAYSGLSYANSSSVLIAQSVPMNEIEVEDICHMGLAGHVNVYVWRLSLWPWRKHALADRV